MIKKFTSQTLLAAMFSLYCVTRLTAQTNPKLSVTFTPDEKVFLLSSSKQAAQIYIDPADAEVAHFAAEALRKDIEMITGLAPKIHERAENLAGTPIIIGTVGQSALLKHESLRTKLQLDRLSGKWEAFLITLIEQPFEKVERALFIAGSDHRGTAYGVFALSKMMGVSPWVWWADVLPDKHNSIFITPGQIIESPSVKYRGIFLNDEDWGLQPWAAKTFEPETGDIGPKTYEKIFRLMLRLKANTIWPAMHPCTKAFFKIPGNKEMASKYSIVVGTSHAEPMLRNNVDEWDREKFGDYNYFTNRHNVKKYWQERLDTLKASNSEFIVTLGMRGIHDSGMEGSKDKQEQVNMLQQIIYDQREMLATTFEKPVESIPQVLIPYKEVLDLYDLGMELPDDITLMCTDDNYGYMRRHNNRTEQKRKGGGGVYYHASYWGRPHDYLWLSTTQPGLLWYEMNRAYLNGAQRIWILNVGDIKPAEYNIELFMDMAWQLKTVNESTIKQHMIQWADGVFGAKYAKSIADMKDEFYRLAMLRKPEYMGWSQTEPTTGTGPTQFSLFANGNEFDRRIEYYKKLEKECDRIKESLPQSLHNRYFQLIEYPIKGAAQMNYKFLYYQKAQLIEDKQEKKQLLKLSENAHDRIQSLTFTYNNNNNAKWLNMMSAKPRKLPVFMLPNYRLENKDRLHKSPTNIAGVFIQAKDTTKSAGAEGYKWKTVEGLGYSNSALTLFPFQTTTFTENLPFVEYTFEVEQAGKYTVEVRCLPTHSNDYNHQLSIQINDNTPTSYSLNTKGRSEQWKINVLRNYCAVVHPVKMDNQGKQILKLSVNQPGIVIDQIAINPAGIAPYYEIPLNTGGAKK